VHASKRLRLPEAQRPVLLFRNGLGDHLTSLPAVRALATMFAGRLSLVCAVGSHHTFFRGLPFLDVVELPFERGQFDVTRVPATPDCDLLLSLNPWHSASVDALLARLRPAHSIGFYPAFATALARDFTKHTVHLAFDVVRAIRPGIRLERFASAPGLSPGARIFARRVGQKLPPGARVLAVHAESAAAEKTWPLPQWREFIARFLDANPGFYVITLGVEDRDLGIGPTRRRVIPACGLPFLSSLALLARADLFAGIDSCLLHAADLFRVPGVGIFGPTSPAEFGFLFARHRHVGGGCATAAVPVADVLAATADLMREVRLLSGPSSVSGLRELRARTSSIQPVTSVNPRPQST
jgi:ADP-heptose:LPS heptosyltransferase